MKRLLVIQGRRRLYYVGSKYVAVGFSLVPTLGKISARARPPPEPKSISRHTAL